MSRYSKVERSLWCDSGFLALSAAAPNAQTLWLYLLTGPHNTSLPGLSRLRLSAVSEELGWEYGATCDVFAELEGAGMAKHDRRAGVVWLIKALRHNAPQSPNVVVGWRDEIRLVPDCALKTEALAALRAEIGALGDHFALALARAFGEAPPMASPNPSGKGSNGSIGSVRPKPLVPGDQSLRSKHANSGAGAGAGAGDPDSDAGAQAGEPPRVSLPSVEPVSPHPEAAAEVLAALSMSAGSAQELELRAVLGSLKSPLAGARLARLVGHVAEHTRIDPSGQRWRPTLTFLRGRDGTWTGLLSLLSEADGCHRCGTARPIPKPKPARPTPPDPVVTPEEHARRVAGYRATREAIAAEAAARKEASR